MDHQLNTVIKRGAERFSAAQPVAILKAPLDADGNTLESFAGGQVVTILSEAANSAGTRTSARRTITIARAIV